MVGPTRRSPVNMHGPGVGVEPLLDRHCCGAAITGEY
jgi:hypothetical protein